MQPLKLITFDFLGTVGRFKGRPLEHYADVIGQSGLKFKKESLGKGFQKAIVETEANLPNFGYGRMTSVSWWTGVVSSTIKYAAELEQQTIKLPNEKIQKLAQALYHRFSGPETYEVFPETIEVLQQVRKEYPETTVGIISNTDERLHTILESLDLMRHFDFVITSKQVGFAKPHPHIFKTALKAAQTQAEESLHVGDNAFNDYEGALNAGMNAVLVNRNPANTQSVCGMTVGIADLKGLPQWLANFTNRKPFTPVVEHHQASFNHALI